MSDGFILSEAAQYAYKCQEVYPDILSFATAIPDHLKPLFLIPVKAELVTASHLHKIAHNVCRASQGGIDVSTPEGDLFSYQTFLYNDTEPTIPSSEPGSIFDIDGADAKTHHQENNFDQNIQSPTETSYMSDVDMSQYWGGYPYRTEEKPVRKSSKNEPHVLIFRIAIKEKDLVNKTPSWVKDNATECEVTLKSYLENVRTYIFDVDSGNGPYVVKAGYSSPEEIAVSCSCPYWRYNGPEYHAKSNDYLMGEAYGTAAFPRVRDPKGQIWLCKHAYSVVIVLKDHIVEVKEEAELPLNDEDLLAEVDSEWAKLAGTHTVDLSDYDMDEIEEWAKPAEVPAEPTEEPEEEQIQLTQEDFIPDEEQIQLTQEDFIPDEEQIQLTQEDIEQLSPAELKKLQQSKKSPPPLPKKPPSKKSPPPLPKSK